MTKLFSCIHIGFNFHKQSVFALIIDFQFNVSGEKVNLVMRSVFKKKKIPLSLLWVILASTVASCQDPASSLLLPPPLFSVFNWYSFLKLIICFLGKLLYRSLFTKTEVNSLIVAWGNVCTVDWCLLYYYPCFLQCKTPRWCLGHLFTTSSLNCLIRSVTKLDLPSH